MKVLIDIPQEMFKATQTYYTDFTTRLSMKTCTEIIANGTPIPEGATNGDMIKAMFPNAEIKSGDKKENRNIVYVWIDNWCVGSFRLDWWNAPYRGVEE